MRRAVLLLAFAGCAGPAAPQPPRPEGERPTVVAVLAGSDAAIPADPAEFAQTLASELARAGGLRVLRPRPGEGTLPVTDADLLRKARAAGADAVIAAALVECDPYDPPRLGVRVQLFRTAPREVSGEEVDRLVRSASWRKGPVALSRAGAPHAAAAFEALYDAREEGVRAALREFARRRGGPDSAFPGEGEFLAVQSRYFEFVAHQVVRRLEPELARSW
ncbi:MAG TPA: hypothetical protein VNO22_05525 [Planctomycetota bacterium]|nr:hypothetical protein [Planctomycetota bacterium]